MNIEWFDLEGAQKFAVEKTGKDIDIREFLRAAVNGDIDIYALAPSGTFQNLIKVNVAENLECNFISFPIEQILLSRTDVELALKFYPASGYEIFLSAPIPDGYAYHVIDSAHLLDQHKADMLITSHEALRIRGDMLDAFIAKAQSPKVVGGVANEAPVNKFTPLVDLAKYRNTKRRILELWVDIRTLHPNSYDATQVMRVLNRNLKDGEKRVKLKTIQNRLGELQAEGVLP